jgi:hypothetical protein
LTNKFHAALEGAAQTDEIRKLQKEIMDYLGTGIHHDAITGTSGTRTAEDYFERLSKADSMIQTMNTLSIQEKLHSQGVKADLSKYQKNFKTKKNEYLIVLQNPQAITDPKREELVCVTIPYDNFEILENDKKVKFDVLKQEYMNNQGKKLETRVNIPVKFDGQFKYLTVKKSPGSMKKGFNSDQKRLQYGDRELVHLKDGKFRYKDKSVEQVFTI